MPRCPQIKRNSCWQLPVPPALLHGLYIVPNLFAQFLHAFCHALPGSLHSAIYVCPEYLVLLACHKFSCRIFRCLPCSSHWQCSAQLCSQKPIVRQIFVHTCSTARKCAYNTIQCRGYEIQCRARKQACTAVNSSTALFLPPVTPKRG